MDEFEYPKPLNTTDGDSGRPYDEKIHSLIKFKPLSQEMDGPKYIFRYISISTFMVMFYAKRFAFRSAVYYKDKDECTYPYDMMLRYFRAKGEINPNFVQEFSSYYRNISFERARYFLSCWFGSDDLAPRETMKNYFSRDGVIVVFEREELLKAFQSDKITFRGCSLGPPIPDRERLLRAYQSDKITFPGDDLGPRHPDNIENPKKQYNPIISGYGSVHYYLDKEFMQDVYNDRLISHPAFAKRKIFELEKEYRFVIDIGEAILETNYFSKLYLPKYAHVLKNFNQGKSIWVDFSEIESLNDIGLVKVISCTKATDSIIRILSNQREVKFWGPMSQDIDVFRQEEGNEIRVENWNMATDPTGNELLRSAEEESKKLIDT